MTNKIKNPFIFRFFVIFLALAPAMYTIFTTNYLNDWYWHSEMGKYFIESKFNLLGHNLPGIGSWFAQEINLNWIAHEWLSEVFMWILVGNNELKAIIFGKILAVVFMFLLLLVSSKNAHLHLMQSSILSLVISVATCQYIYARPHVFSYFFVFFTVYISNKIIKGNRKFGLLLFPLAILWANMHGGSSNLIYIIPIIYGLVSLPNKKFFSVNFSSYFHDNFFHNGRKNALICLLYGFSSILFLLINPYFYEIIRYPYVNMADTTMLNYIAEWRIPNINNIYGFLMFLALALFFFVFVSNRQQTLYAYDLFILAFGAFLFLKSARFFPYFAIILAFTLPKYMLSERKKELSLDYRLKTILMVFPIFFFVSMSYVGFMDFKSTNFIPTDAEISKEMIDTIKEYNPKRMYNHFNLGAYLIHNEIPVFIDGRADMYSGETFDNFVKIATGVYEYNGFDKLEKILNIYNFDSFICLKDEPMNLYFETHTNDYYILFEDELTVFWIKK